MEIFDEIRKMQREMDRAFGETFFRSPRLLPTKTGVVKQPETDVQETDKEVIATFDLPGVEKGDIELHVDKNSISVKAEKKHEVEEKKKDYLHQERSYTSFCRSFTLPAEVNPDQVDADYKDGVLIVRMAKREVEHKKRKQIEIK